MVTYRCDMCGRPATNAAVDTIRTDEPGDAFITRAPVGPAKYGCDVHPVESREVTR